MGRSSIGWTDWTVNPIRARNRETGAVGHFCERITPGCAHCYAAEWNKRVRPVMAGLVPARDPETGKQRFLGTGLDYLPANRPKVEFFLDRSKLEEVYRRQKPTKFFWCDMTDLFGEWVPDEWIDQCFAIMALTPQHTHQILTKRPERMRAYCEALRNGKRHLGDALGDLGEDRIGTRLLVAQAYGVVPGSEGTPPYQPFPNAWLGVSAEDQATLEARWAILREIPAAVRFLSLEPLLSKVDLRPILGGSDGALEDPRCLRCGLPWWDDDGNTECPPGFGPRPDWVIVGGESGPKARPCDVAWMRSIVEQCKVAGVSVFVKQLGTNPVTDHRTRPAGEEAWVLLKSRSGSDPSEWPADLRVQEFPEARS